LSRFDLIFILLDRPDEARDAMLSEHVIALHSKTKSKNRALAFDELNRTISFYFYFFDIDATHYARFSVFCPGSRSRAIAFDDISQSTSSQTALIERLHLPASENDPIPPWLFRKYIAYARKFVKPRFLSFFNACEFNSLIFSSPFFFRQVICRS
jgi:DNA helicase MCM8